MCSESLPKEFEKGTEVLPFEKFGTSTLKDFQKAENTLQRLEWLSKAGLNEDEIQLYRDYEQGCMEKYSKVETGVLNKRLFTIHQKIQDFQSASVISEPQPTTSTAESFLNKTEKAPVKTYPDGHPMNQVKELEDNLFGYIKNDIVPITKRRKVMRRYERKKQRILNQECPIPVAPAQGSVDRPGSLWDVKDMPSRSESTRESSPPRNIVGPRRQNMYTVQENRIVRLEPVAPEDNDEFRAVDLVMPQNAAEAQLLEGTKMSVDDIRKIDRFKDYEPGVPSKVLYLKNISPNVSQERLSLLFNQFVLENGGPVDLRLMSGRMREQAFVTFSNEDLAIRALDEVNGTILSGRPVIAEFGRNSNRIQNDDVR